MRIAFAGSPDLGLGPATHLAVGLLTRAVAQRLKQAGEVTIYRSDDVRGVDTVDGITYRPIAAPGAWYARWLSAFDCASGNPVLRPFLFQSLMYYPRSAARLGSSLRREATDVLHLHNFFQAIPALRARNPGMTIVLHMHCEWLFAVDRAFGEACLSGADLILGCSDYISNQIRASYPAHAARVETLPNGVDADCFRPAASRAQRSNPRIVFAGRLSPEKGLHVLLDAMRLLSAEFPDARLEIIGPNAAQPRYYLQALGDPLVDPRRRQFGELCGPHYAHVLRARANAQLPGRVDFCVTGVPQEWLADRFAGADVLVNPSLVESFGMTVLEAMASGIPVVATQVGGMPELVRDGVTGRLVPPNDARALADGIADLLRDPERRRAMGTAARAIADAKYRWDHVAARYERLLAAALPRHATESPMEFNPAV